MRIPLVKDIEVGKDYHLILDVDIADTAGIHLPAARDIVFHGVDAGADKPGMEVVEGFESTDGFSVMEIPAYDTESKITASTDRLFGNKSLQFAYVYNFDIEYYGRSQGFIFDEAPAVKFSRGDTLGIHVWGDMSYNIPSVILSIPCDGYSYVWPIELGEINFHGWRYLEIPLDLPADSTFQLYGFSIRHNHPLMGKSGGTIKFDNLLKKASSGVDETRLADMKVNVGGDYIVVSADTWVQGVELIDVNGRTVKAAGGNCLNVADVDHGIYIVRVHINGQTATHKVRL